MKRIKAKHLIIVLTLVSIYLMLSLVLVTNAQAFKRLTEKEKIINFTLKSINGKEISVKDYEGKSPLAILFWKISSDRCTEEMDVLQGLYNKYKDTGFEILAVYSPNKTDSIGDDEMNKIYEIVAERNYTFQILLDAGLNVYDKYGVLTLPSLALVSKDGIVEGMAPGFPKFSGKRNLTNSVMKLLGIEPPKKEVKIAKYQPDKKAERYYGIAQKMLKSGFYGKAEKNLQQAISIDSAYADAYALLGNVYASKGSIEMAEKNFKISLGLDSTNAGTHFHYGLFCRDRNMNECAQAEFEEVLKLEPESGNGHYGLGTMYMVQKKYDEAIGELEEAIRLFEEVKSEEPILNLGHSYFNLALIANELKQEDKSIKKFQQANIEYKKIVKNLASSVD